MFAVDNEEFFVWFQLTVVKLLERASRQHFSPRISFTRGVLLSPNVTILITPASIKHSLTSFEMVEQMSLSLSSYLPYFCHLNDWFQSEADPA